MPHAISHVRMCDSKQAEVRARQDARVYRPRNPDVDESLCEAFEAEAVEEGVQAKASRVQRLLSVTGCAVSRRSLSRGGIGEIIGRI